MTISPKCIRPIRIALLASLLILSSIPFLVVNYVQNNNVVDDAWSRLWSGPRAPHSSSSSSSLSSPTSKGGARAKPRGIVPQSDKVVIRPASCRDVLADATIYDPNKDIASKESTRRLTVTVPQFYISLHSESFDKMRWIHIMKQGEYYERGLTSLFHRLLSSYDTNVTGGDGATNNVRPPLVLDIGMNIGWFSLYSRAHGHDVASFEPNPTMFLRMCESLEYNNWKDDDGSVTLWNYGLGATG